MGDIGIFWPTLIMAGASVVNVLVLAVYAWYTRGILGATRQSALQAEGLARQARDAFKLQLLLGHYEMIRQIRSIMVPYSKGDKATERSWVDALKVFRAAFPDEFPSLLQDLTGEDKRPEKEAAPEKDSPSASA